MVAERAAEEARQNARNEAAEASAMAHKVIDDQIKASKQAEALMREEANAAISQRDAQIHVHRLELHSAVTNATENFAKIQGEMTAQAAAASHQTEIAEQRAKQQTVHEQEEISAFKAAAQERLTESEQQFQRRFAAEKALAEAAFVDEVNRLNVEHQANMAEALRTQDHMLMTTLSTRFVNFKERIKHEHQEKIDRLELSAQNYVNEAAKRTIARKRCICQSSLRRSAESTYKLNVMPRLNASRTSSA